VIRAAAVRAGLFALGWWAMGGGFAYQPLLAALAVAAATAASLALVPPRSWRWTLSGALRFLPFFLRESLAGGVDVARRAFSPTPRLRPGFVEFRTRLPPGPSRVFLMNAMNLLPGTLSARDRDGSILVHVLDLELPTEARLRALEARVAALFGVAVREG
jgi:multicomponent Na+:H+ antiporter subunit E